jgi:hypothetical protein
LFFGLLEVLAQVLGFAKITPKGGSAAGAGVATERIDARETPG